MGMKKRGAPFGYVRKLYTIYDNRDDRLMCLDATASEAAKILGMTEASFRCTVSRVLKGENKKWHIEVLDNGAEEAAE